MTLKHKPFEKLYQDDKDKTLQKFLYHLHRAVELGHRFEKEYYKYEKPKNTDSVSGSNTASNS